MTAPVGGDIRERLKPVKSLERPVVAALAKKSDGSIVQPQVTLDSQGQEKAARDALHIQPAPHQMGPSTLSRLSSKASAQAKECLKMISIEVVDPTKPLENIETAKQLMKSFVSGTSPDNETKSKPKNRIKALFEAVKRTNSPELLKLFEKTFDIKDMTQTFKTVDLNTKDSIQKVRDIDHRQTMACFQTPAPEELPDGSFRIGAHFTDAKGAERVMQGAELQQNLMLAYALTGTHKGPTSTHFMHGDRCTIIASNEEANSNAHKELLRTLGVDKESHNEALSHRETQLGPVTITTRVSSHGFKIHDGTLTVENLNYYDFLSKKEGKVLTPATQLHFNLLTKGVINNDGKVLIKDEKKLTIAVSSFRDFKGNGLNEAQIKLVVKTIIYQGQEGVPVETKGLNAGAHQLMGQIAVGGAGNMVIDSNGVAQTIKPDGTNGSLCIVAKEDMKGPNGTAYAAVAFGIEGANPLETNMHTGKLHLETGRHDVKAGGQSDSLTMAQADDSFAAGLGSKEVTLNAQELKILTEKMTLLKQARETHPKQYEVFADKLLSAPSPQARATLYQSFANWYNRAIGGQTNS